MKLSKKYLIPTVLGFLGLSSPVSASTPIGVYNYTPNNHGKSVTTPVAWGASNNVVFMGVGGTYESPYTNKADGAAMFGYGLGDPKKNVGVQVAFISLDLTEWEEYSSAIHLSKNLGNADAIGVGVENIMLTDGGDSGVSYYVVYSRASQDPSVINPKTNKSKLHYSVGVGKGRFSDMSDADKDPKRGNKGEHGTYVFGNVSYEVFDACNIVTDWNGMNLNAGLSKSFMLGKLPFAATVGVADLTGYSGDGARLVVAGGFGFKL